MNSPLLKSRATLCCLGSNSSYIQCVLRAVCPCQGRWWRHPYPVRLRAANCEGWKPNRRCRNWVAAPLRHSLHFLLPKACAAVGVVHGCPSTLKRI
jgi:hypothetical protein